MDKQGVMLRLQCCIGYIQALSDSFSDDSKPNIASSLANIAKDLDWCVGELDGEEEVKDDKPYRCGFLSK